MNPSAMILPMEPQPEDADEVFWWEPPYKNVRSAPEGLWARKHGGNGYLRWIGRRPVQPGERVPLREVFAYRVDVNCKTEREKAVHYLLYKGDGGDPHDDNNWHTWSDWQPAERMPDWAVRRWLLVRTVEARRVESITDREAKLLGVPEPTLKNLPDWLARHGAGQWCWLLKGEVVT